MRSNQTLRQRAADLQGYRCYYCGFPIWETDVSAFAKRYAITERAARRFRSTAEHVQALGDGGKTNAENIVAACIFCNKTRHARPGRISAAAYLALVHGRLAAHRWHGAQFNKLIEFRHARA